MDAKALYPKGFHPVYTFRLPETADFAPILPRYTAHIVYYYVDFGISSHIPTDSPDKLVLGDLGRDQSVPELSTTIPYDPFKVDVFILGNVFQRLFGRVSSICPLGAEIIDWMRITDLRKCGVSGCSHTIHDYARS
jgi:hypothetical protein